MKLLLNTVESATALVATMPSARTAQEFDVKPAACVEVSGV